MTDESRVLIEEVLAETAEAAIRQAEDLITATRTESIPELEHAPGVVRLEGREGLGAIHRYLDLLESQMRGLCAPHEFRSLLVGSRVCSGLERFRLHEPDVGDSMLRCQPADYAALAFGRRDLSDQVYRDSEGDYGFRMTENIASDVVILHCLAREYRQTMTALMVANFLTELRREENRVEKQRLNPIKVEVAVPHKGFLNHSREPAMAFGPAFYLVADEEALGYAKIFLTRHSSQVGPISHWGCVRLREDQVTTPAALWMPFAEPHMAEYDLFFMPEKRGIASLHEIGEKFRELFNERFGMPPAHLCSILQGLSQIAFDREFEAAEYLHEGGYPNVFFGKTGAMLIDQSDLESGALLEKSAEAMARDYPDVAEAANLGTSIGHFIEIASSSGKQETLRLRGMRPAYLLHGESHHKTWLVDFNAMMPFIQHLLYLLEVTEETSTVDPGNHDADVRTSLFDAELAPYLERVEGVDLAFIDHRVQSDLPNVRLPMSPGEDLEVDIPLRVGSVFVPVQTRTSVVDFLLDEGDYEVFRRRWKATKEKRRKTDKRYAEKLLDDPIGRKFLYSAGVTHILPIVCVPYPDPVAAAGRAYWLRHPSDEPLQAVLEGHFRAVPRILTSGELGEFLSEASESELKRVSEEISSGTWRV